jgi:ribosomal protein S17E
MEIKDMIAGYLLTRRIKQIEDQVKNKPEIKAKIAKK